MHSFRHPLTPLAAVVGGILAWAVGTVCLDAVEYQIPRVDTRVLPGSVQRKNSITFS
jgi:hypothetical protein